MEAAGFWLNDADPDHPQNRLVTGKGILRV